jgi:hypothetical protein
MAYTLPAVGTGDGVDAMVIEAPLFDPNTHPGALSALELNCSSVRSVGVPSEAPAEAARTEVETARNDATDKPDIRSRRKKIKLIIKTLRIIAISNNQIPSAIHLAPISPFNPSRDHFLP